MSTFVLLWGSAAIFTRWGLDHGSVLALLMLRYAIALTTLAAAAHKTGRLWPDRGTRWQIARTGALLIGGYSICYFQAMAHGITPGLLATLLGIQPILTLLMTERRFAYRRLLGLLAALAGLALVVHQSLTTAKLSIIGMGYAFGALTCMTVGALQQKRIHQAPGQVLPLQYAVTLGMYLCLAPFQSFSFDLRLGFWVPLLYLGLVISVGAQLMLYRLIRTGNLVNVTSLFYLVPPVTVVFDYLVLGNSMSPLSIAGMAAILAGVILAFRFGAAARPGTPGTGSTGG